MYVVHVCEWRKERYKTKGLNTAEREKEDVKDRERMRKITRDKDRWQDGFVNNRMKLLVIEI